jgi:N2,N2-dimethylguanosine tRNA methyltransferase
VASSIRALSAALVYLRTNALFPKSFFPMTAVPPASATVDRHIKVPPGYKLHTENSAHILLPDTDDAFLNPVQEFNRDLSVASIQVWAEQRDAIKKEKWLERQKGKQDSKSSSKRRKCSWVPLDVRWSLIWFL